MNIDQDETVHERRIRVRLGWRDLRTLIEDHLAAKLGITSEEAYALDISLEQETEGSPAYNVAKWKVKATGTAAPKEG